MPFIRSAARALVAALVFVSRAVWRVVRTFLFLWLAAVGGAFAPPPPPPRPKPPIAVVDQQAELDEDG